MTITTIEERVKKIIADQLCDGDFSQVDRKQSLVDDLGADSLDTVELVMALEDEFEIDIDDDAADKVHTVQQAIDLVNAGIAAK